MFSCLQFLEVVVAVLQRVVLAGPGRPVPHRRAGGESGRHVRDSVPGALLPPHLRQVCFSYHPKLGYFFLNIFHMILK